MAYFSISTGSIFRFIAAPIVLILTISGCSTLPPAGVQVVKPFDVLRYEGKWYEIARLDHSFERGMSDVSATYRRQTDGSLEVLNRGYDPQRGGWRQAIGRALFNGPTDEGSLKVSFFGPFYGGYHVVDMDRDNYRWSMVMGPDRGYFWILAREKHISPELRERLVHQAQQLGIKTERLIWVSQKGQDEG